MEAMEISTFTAKLFILLLPGVIASSIYNTLTVRSFKRSEFMFVIKSFVVGMLAYLTLQIFYCIFQFFRNTSLTLTTVLPLETFKLISEDTIPYLEVLLASLISVFLGFWMVRLDHTKAINNFAQSWNISNKFGDENLFTKFVNSPDTNWVHVKDIQNNLTYFGRVTSFSECEAIREIVLDEVTVYSYDENIELYDTPRVYLSYEIGNLIIEKAD